MRYIDSDLRLALIGATSSFFGNAIGEAINNEFIEKNHKRINISAPGYYSSVIAGAFSAPIIEKTNLLNGVILAVGLNKALFDVVDKCAGNKGLDYNFLIRDFIFDSIVAFFLVSLIYETIDAFKNLNGTNQNNTNKNQNQVNNNNNQNQTNNTNNQNQQNANDITNPEGGQEESNISLDIIISIVINVYYAIKRNIVNNK